MNEYISTRPLFEKICKKSYSPTMISKIRHFKIKDFYVEQKLRGKIGKGVGKVNYYMTMENWNKIKETLKEV